MHVLEIEHAVADFDSWKRAFENDPVGRKQGGVLRYQVLRTIDNPNYVKVDLEFDSQAKAQAFGAALRELWRRVEGSVIEVPRARLFEVVERNEY
jgi:hypothetical protein